MGDIKDFEKEKQKRGIEKIKETYLEIFGEDILYDKASKLNDGYYRLAKKIYLMKDDSTIDWCINDGCSRLGMGLKKIWMFDCDLIISASYGGGLESVLWAYDDLTIDDIYQWLKVTYSDYEYMK